MLKVDQQQQENARFVLKYVDQVNNKQFQQYLSNFNDAMFA